MIKNRINENLLNLIKQSQKVHHINKDKRSSNFSKTTKLKLSKPSPFINVAFSTSPIFEGKIKLIVEAARVNCNELKIERVPSLFRILRRREIKYVIGIIIEIANENSTKSRPEMTSLIFFKSILKLIKLIIIILVNIESIFFFILYKTLDKDNSVSSKF